MKFWVTKYDVSSFAADTKGYKDMSVSAPTIVGDPFDDVDSIGSEHVISPFDFYSLASLDDGSGSRIGNADYVRFVNRIIGIQSFFVRQGEELPGNPIQSVVFKLDPIPRRSFDFAQQIPVDAGSIVIPSCRASPVSGNALHPVRHQIAPIAGRIPADGSRKKSAILGTKGMNPDRRRLVFVGCDFLGIDQSIRPIQYPIAIDRKIAISAHVATPFFQPDKEFLDAFALRDVENAGWFAFRYRLEARVRILFRFLRDGIDGNRVVRRGDRLNVGNA